MSLLRTLRRKKDQSIRRPSMTLETLEPRLLLNADLAVDMFGFDDGVTPPPFHLGDTVAIATDLSNIGDADSGAFGVEILLSNDNTPDGGDFVLHTGTANSITAGGSDIYDVNVSLPNDSRPDGDYYLIFKADTGSETGDTNMTNNVNIAPIFIGDPPPMGDPDLTPTTFSTNPSGPYEWGQTVTVTADFKNIGDNNTGGDVTVDILLNNGGTETPLQSFTVSPLDPNQDSFNNLNITLPASGADGDQELVMRIDPGNAIPESNETNNQAVLMVNIGSAPEIPDLCITNFIPMSPYALGQDFNVTNEIKNATDSTTPAFDVHIVLSTDDVIDGSDPVLAQRTIASLGPMGQNEAQTTVSLPDDGSITPGDYYLGIIADPTNAVDEGPFENNNSMFMNIHIDSAAGPDIDLQPINVFLPGGPFEAGSTLSVTSEVNNYGSESAMGVNMRLAFSATDDFASFDVLDEWAVMGITAGGSDSHTQNVTLPAGLSDGQYYIALVADYTNTIEEFNEENNKLVVPVMIGSGDPPPPAGTELELVTFEPNITGDLEWGQTVNANIDIANFGDTDAPAPFNVAVYLSNDDLVDGGDTELTSYTINTLTAGQFDSHNIDITLPAEGADGGYFLIAKADSAEAITEPEENNNDWEISVQIGSPGQPPAGGIDLESTVFNPNITGDVPWGQTLNIDATVANIGDTESGEFTVSFLFNNTGNFDGTEIELASYTVNPLGGGLSDLRNSAVTLPASGTDGDYFLMLKVDSTDAIAESDESNNVWTWLVQMGEIVVPEGKELEPTIFDLNVTGDVMWGDLLNVEIDVANFGFENTGSFEVTLWLSQNSSLDGAAVELTSYTVDDIGLDVSDYRSVPVMLPADGYADGQYHIILQVDSTNNVYELNEDNNQWSAPLFIGQSGQPGPVEGIDLGVFGPDLPDMMDLVWGQTYDAIADAFNMGDTDAGAFTITVALSADENYDIGSDTVLIEIPISSLPAQSDSPNDIDLTLPADGFTDGLWYVLVVADSNNTIAEVDEMNNITFQQVNIVATPNLNPGIDLMVMGVNLEKEPPAPGEPDEGPQWGQTYPAIFDIINIGDTPSGPCTAVIALSIDPDYNPAEDTILATINLAAIAAGATSANDLTVTLPAEGALPDGQYYIIGIVDDTYAVNESDETNNTLSHDLYIGQGGDPVGDDVELQADSLFIDFSTLPQWGAALDVTAGIRNAGGADAQPFDVTIYFSQYDQITTNAVALTSFHLDSLGAGQFWTENLSVTLPADGDQGQYFLIMHVDSADTNVEPSEEDNLWIAPIYIGDAPMTDIDLMPDFNSNIVPPMDIVWGTQHMLPVDIFNQGNAPAGLFTVSVLISADDIHDESDYVLATLDVPGIAPWSDSINDVPVTLPAPGVLPDGQYYAIIVVDTQNTVDEINEDNNVRVQPINLVSTPDLPEGIDLIPVEFDDDLWGDAQWGMTFPVFTAVVNAADTESGNFTISVALSNDNVYDAYDLVVGSVVSSSVMPGEFMTNMIDVTLPAAGEMNDGDYYLVLFVDSTKAITEINETNNKDFMDITIGQGSGEPIGDGIDLVPAYMPGDNIAPPYDLTWGQQYQLALDVKNAGPDAAGAFTVSLVLSQDDIVDASDITLKTFDIYGLGGWTDSINDKMVTLPAAGTLPDGDYHLIMIVDVDNDVEETIEDNNTYSQMVSIFSTANLDQGVDLVFTKLDDDVIGDFQWGMTYDMTAEIYNAGDTTAEDFALGVVLSQDMTYDPAVDILVGGWTGETLDAGELTEKSFTITLPDANGMPDGTFYLLAMVDAYMTIDETDEMNNFRSMDIFVGKDGAPPMGDGVDIAIPFVQVPGPVAAGQPMDVLLAVENWGSDDTPAFTVQFYLSEDPFIDVDEFGAVADSEILLGEMQMDAILAGSGPNELTTSLTLPAELEFNFYHIMAVANLDHAIEESDYFNNIGIGFIDIMGAGTDVAVTDLFMPYDAQWGQSITIDANIANFASQTIDSVDVNFYLSADFEFDGGDQLLGSATLTDLAPGMQLMATANITLPDQNTDGLYTLIAVVDPTNAIDELDEYNNYWYRDLYIGQAEQANLMAWPMIHFEGQSNIDWGQSLDMETVINNAGNTTTAAFDVTYYLSADDTLDTNSDILLHTETVAQGLMPFENYFQNLSIPLPADDPSNGAQQEWFIFAKADGNNAIAEFDETDNAGWCPIFIGSQPADLMGWFDITDDEAVTWGQSISLEGKIENFGGADSGSFTVEYYLTDDPDRFMENPPTILDSDILLTTQSITNIAANSNTNVISTIALPTDPGQFGSGTIFVIAVIDADNTVAEMDEWNNRMGDWLTTDVAAPELSPYYINPYVDSMNDTGPAQPPVNDWGTPIYWGQSFNVGFGIDNRGSLDAENVLVNFYLTGNDGNFANAVLIGSTTIDAIVADLFCQDIAAVNLPTASQVSFADPNHPDGTYMLIMVVDPDNTIPEIVEQNNMFMIPIRLETQSGMMEITDSMNMPNDMMIDLGPVLEGNIYNQTITVANTGAGTLNINGFNISGDLIEISYDGAVLGDTDTFTIEPDQSLTFDVTFNAASQGYHQGDIQILSDAGDAWINVWADVAFAPADLAVQKITTPKSANWGQDIALSIDIANLESGPVEQALVEVMISNTNDPSQGDFIVYHLQTESIQNLAGDSSTKLDLNVHLPETSPFGYGGQLYMHVVVNPMAAFDTNFDNNEAFAAMQITSAAVGKPDLSFAWLGIPPEADWGQDISIDLGIANFGMADAGAFKVNYYLSTDDQRDSSDQLLNPDDSALPGLSAMEQIQQQLTATLPAEGDQDIYYIIIQIDPANTVAEEFEDNNTAVGRIRMNSLADNIDLIAESISAPAEVTVGSNFDISLQVTNDSNIDAQMVRIEFFLADPAMADDPFFMGHFLGSTKANLPAGQTTDINYNAYMPEGFIMPGQQYLVRALVDADQFFTETNEDNNLIAIDAAAPVTVSGGNIDLSGSFFDAPNQATWDEMVSVTITLANNGDIESSPFFVDLFLSSDTELDPEDFYLNSQMVFALSNDNEQVVLMNAVLPMDMPNGDGQYYLLAKIDGGQSVVETNEDNNVLTSPLAIAGTPDLALTFQDVPGSANFGQTITVTDKVKNWGNSASDATTIDYYLSKNDIFGDDDDSLLGSRTVAALALETSATGTAQLTLPTLTQQGVYHIIAVVDPENQIAETFEDDIADGSLQTNNVAISTIDLVSQGMPDLKPTALSIAAEDADWGDTIVVQNTIANQGAANITTPFTVSFYLSDNASITAKDILLGTRTISSLTAGNTNQQSTTLTLPDTNPFAEDGDFYIGVKVDSAGAVAEINEENNITVTTDTVTIGNVINVDLVAAFIANPNFAVGGENLECFYEVYNAGAAKSGAFTVDFYLTEQGTIDDSAILLGTDSIASLGANAFASQMIDVAIAEDYAGQSFVLAMQVNPDQSVLEKTYTNNTTFAMNAFSVTEPIDTDLAVSNVQTDSEAQWGDTITVDFQLDVTGDLSGSVTIGFFISQPGSLTGQVQVGQSQIALTGEPMIAAHETITFTSASAMRDGDYTLTVIADPYDAIPETQMINNAASATITIGSTQADLVALSISGVTTAQAGDQIDVFNELANYGSVAAGGFDTYFYLSTDTTLSTSTDTYIGMRHINALAAGDTNWTLSTLTIPSTGVADGDYYLIMSADRFDDVDESNENNNTVASAKKMKIKTISISPDDNEPNNSTGTATAVTFDAQGQTDLIEASIHNSSDKDYYSFTVPTTGDGFAKIQVNPDETLNAAIFLYDSNGVLVTSADADPNFAGQENLNTFSLTPGRSYKLLVKPIGDSFGNYTLTAELGIGTAGDDYESNNSIDTAYYLGVDPDPFDDANLHNGSDVDYYQFAIPATSTGQTTITIEPDPYLDTILQIYDNDGNLITSSDSGGAGADESVSFTGTIGDKYYAKISSWANSTGAYACNIDFTAAQLPDSYESNDSIAHASQLNDDNLASTSIQLTTPTIHTADTDVYSFTLPAAMSQVGIYLFASQGLDAQIALYDTDGALVKAVDRTDVNESETLLADQLTPGSQYFVQVTGQNDTSGKYSLEIEAGNAAVGDLAEPNNLTTTAFPLELNDQGRAALEGLSLHSTTDKDYFSFIAPNDADGTATITVKPTTASTALNVSLRLIDADGATVKSTDAAAAGQTETLTLTSGLTPGEEYILEVNGWATTGDYKLTVVTPLAAEAAAAQMQTFTQPQISYVGPLANSSAFLADGSEPEIVVVEDVAASNDNNLSFGATPVGTSLTYTFTVLNTGGSTLNLTDLSIAGNDADAFSVTPDSATLATGQSQSFSVTFAPDAVGTYADATLTITNNDTSEGQYELSLGGTATVSANKPDITVVDTQSSDLTTLTFTDTAVDETSTASFLILNDGAATLTVSSAVLSGDDASAFSLAYTNLPSKTSDDYSIAAAGQKLIQVRFSPSASGDYQAVLTLTSNDPDETTTTITLVGAAVEPNLIVDLTPTNATVANALNPAISFGAVVNDGQGGQKGTFPINIVNSGDSTLTISSITFGTNSPFSISGVDTAGFTVAPGQTIAANVIFDPKFNGSFSDTMTVNSDDPGTPEMQFALSGTAAQAASRQLAAGESFEYTEADGDTISVVFGKGKGSVADITFNGSSESGSNISGIDITSASKSGTLVITVTGGTGNGLADITDIDIDAAFGTIQIVGSVDNITVAGALNILNLTGEIEHFSADGAVKTFTTAGITGDVTADSFSTMTINGDVTNATITTDPTAKNSSIKTLTVNGDIADTAIETGSIGKFTVTGDVDNLTIETTGTKASLGTTNITGNVDGFNVTAPTLKALNITGDLLNTVLTANGAKNSVGAINVTGDADLTLTVDGALKSITTGGDLAGAITATGAKGAIGEVSVGDDLTASLAAYKSIKSINAAGTITADSITVTGSGKGSLGSLTAGQDVTINNLNVDGAIKTLTIGSDSSPADLAGAINVTGDKGSITTMTVYGDLLADVTASYTIKTATVMGNLDADAAITAGSSITKLYFGDTIYGSVSANNGQGSIKQIQRIKGAFVNPNTETTDNAAAHILADMSKTKWLSI